MTQCLLLCHYAILSRSAVCVCCGAACTPLPFDHADVEDIKFVVNYDYPSCSEDYVHRIGRTGRRNNKGTAYTFFTRVNSKQAGDLIGVLREANQAVNPKLYEMAQQSSRFGGRDNRRRRWGGGPPKNDVNGFFSQKRKFDGDHGYGGPAKRPYGGFGSGY